MALKSKILIIGGTGYIGKYMVEESAKAGHPTFALVRENTASNPEKYKLIESFKSSGVTLFHGDIYHHESLVKAIKQVDVVISALGSPEQIADQMKIVAAIEEAGNIKVYINSSNVDDYLVESIARPAADPNAGEVYYRLMSRFMLNQSKYTLEGVVSELSCPLLLQWGDLDPWVGPAKANRIKEFYPKTSLVNLKARHCPHDEVPELANKALLDWLSGLTLEASPQSL